MLDPLCVPVVSSCACCQFTLTESVLVLLSALWFVSLCLGSGDTYPGHFFRASSPYSLVNWQVSSNFVYKLFPDVLVFHCFVAAIAMISLVSHSYPEARRLLHRRVWVSCPHAQIMYCYTVHVLS